MNAFLAATLLSAALAAEEGSFDRSFNMSGSPRVEIQTGSGSIEVRTGASSTIEVHGVIRARSWLPGLSGSAEKVRRIEENPPIVQEGNVLRVGGVVQSNDELYEGVSISYELVVPAETSLVSKTGSGSQIIGDIRGPVEARAGSGSLTIGKTGGDVQARAGSGSIQIAGAGGNLDVRTGSGSITADSITGAILAHAGSGSIEVGQTGTGDVSIESGSGRVRVRGVRGGLNVTTSSGSIRAQGEILGDWILEASSGSITVELPADAAFELDAHTGSGNIDSDHPVTVSGRLSRKELRGAVRGGGRRLQIETSSGPIVIR